jgi:hypothetical protein
MSDGTAAMIALLVLFFIGTPDLHDAMMQWLTTSSSCK